MTDNEASCACGTRPFRTGHPAGNSRGGRRDTFFPHGTTPADILDMAQEAAKQARESIGPDDLFEAVLRNGKVIMVKFNQYRIQSMYPKTVGDGFGHNLSDIANSIR